MARKWVAASAYPLHLRTGRKLLRLPGPAHTFLPGYRRSRHTYTSVYHIDNVALADLRDRHQHSIRTVSLLQKIPAKDIQATVGQE